MVQTTTLSSTDLNAIVSRLRELARTTASSSSVPVPPPVQPSQQTYSAPATLQSVPNVSYAQPPPPPSMVLANYQAPSIPTPVPTPSFAATLPFLSQLPPAAALAVHSTPVPAPTVIALPPTSTPSVAATPSIPDVSALFKNLVAAGIIKDPSTSASKTSAIDADASKIEPVVESVKQLEVDPKLIVLREYEKRIMSVSATLTGSALQRCVRSSLESSAFSDRMFSLAPSVSCYDRLQPFLISMMYEELPLKCRQCSKRFADTEVGRKARDDHLDAHFRQNKRANMAVGRGHGRSWFVGVEVSCMKSSHFRHILVY